MTSLLINSNLLAIKIRLQIRTTVFHEPIPVTNHATSVSCGTHTSNDGNPEGSGSHDDEGLGVVGRMHL